MVKMRRWIMRIHQQKQRRPVPAYFPQNHQIQFGAPFLRTMGFAESAAARATRSPTFNGVKARVCISAHAQSPGFPNSRTAAHG